MCYKIETPFCLLRFLHPPMKNFNDFRAFLVSSELLTQADLTRMRSTACVAPAKNNFIWESIEKRDKRMQDAGRCAGRYLAAEQSQA
jgi:hypothetical protein